LSKRFGSGGGNALQTVVVVAETIIYRQGIAAHLRASRRFRVVESCEADDHPVVDECDGYIVDVTDDVVGARLDELCGTLQIHEIPVIACGLGADDASIIACLEAGALAYVTKNASLDELLRTVTTTIRDGACVESADLPAILARLRSGRIEEPGPAPPPVHDLTCRELEVARLLGDHLSNKEIAAELNTVKHHVHNVMAKLKVTRRSQTSTALRRAGSGCISGSLRTSGSLREIHV
jgi:DNA-binding NarL/FixJ family response regulator